MNAQELIADTARTLVASDKGLLAMNENNPTCNKRFVRQQKKDGTPFAKALTHPPL